MIAVKFEEKEKIGLQYALETLHGCSPFGQERIRRLRFYAPEERAALEEELITGRTFFRTTVQKVYKGDIPHEFVLAQEGCSTWTYRNYPVFTYGNQLLLFLIKYDVSMYRDTYDLVEYPDAYELISTYSTVMYVTQDDSGMSYVLDALGVMTEWSQINQPTDCPAVAHPGQDR